MNTLRSIFDPTTNSIALELVVAERVGDASRLALTSIVQLTPSPSTEARMVKQLATYHEFERTMSTPLDRGDTWAISGLSLSHPPRHANDGPVSAFLVLADATTVPVTVEPMQRLGEGEHPPVTRTETVVRELPALVPYPRELELLDPHPSRCTSASLESGPDDARAAWTAIAGLDRRSGTNRLVDGGGARITCELDAALQAEQYRLVIAAETVAVTAGSVAGFRHAFVTLAQWLLHGLPSHANVIDSPRFAFRGLHIDLARQWFEPEVVERLIDIAAWRKMSHLHLHLSDDEGWRLPVDDLPELATVASVRGHGLALPPMLGGGSDPTGRAYTRDEISRWVTRADELGVALVPEIDLPAHVHAALAALPELRDPDDTSGAVSVQYFTDNVLIPGHPMTRRFVERVVDSLAALFPTSPWFHIGGDEIPDGAWSGSPMVADFKRDRGLQTMRGVESAFHRDLIAVIRQRAGRGVGSWEEAAESGGVQPGDGYVVGWRAVEASRQLAAKGYDVVVSPGQAYYLDMAVDDEWSTPGSSWAGSTSLADVCEFDPEAEWSDDELAHLLGVQACLWTEHVRDEETLRRSLFPRLDAIAERAWTGKIVDGPASLRQRARLVEGLKP